MMSVNKFRRPTARTWLSDDLTFSQSTFNRFMSSVLFRIYSFPFRVLIAVPLRVRASKTPKTEAIARWRLSHGGDSFYKDLIPRPLMRTLVTSLVASDVQSQFSRQGCTEERIRVTRSREPDITVVAATQKKSAPVKRRTSWVLIDGRAKNTPVKTQMPQFGDKFHAFRLRAHNFLALRYVYVFAHQAATSAGYMSGRICSAGISVSAATLGTCRAGTRVHCVTAEGTIPRCSASFVGPTFSRTFRRGAS